MQHRTSPTERPLSPASAASTIGMRPLPPRPSSIPTPGPSQRSPNSPLDPNQQVPSTHYDIRNLTYERRRNLAMGPHLRITSGTATFKIPISLFRAASKLASRIDTSDPLVPKFTLMQMSPGPISYLIEWLRKVVTEQRAPYLQVIGDMKKDLAVVRAGKMLGLDDYVQDMFNFYWRHFKKGKLTYGEIEVVLSLTVSKEDSFFR